MGNLELLDIGNNIAAFGRSGYPQEQQGLISWSEPAFQSEGKYTVDVSGKDTQGQNINSTGIEIEVEGDLNPTKVFWAIYKALDKLVCPNCDKGF